jgi:hypothetical protein
LNGFRGSVENSTQDRMGGIRGKPAVEDLLKIKKDVKVSAEKN